MGLWGRDWADFSAPAAKKFLGGLVGGAAGDALSLQFRPMKFGQLRLCRGACESCVLRLHPTGLGALSSIFYPRR